MKDIEKDLYGFDKKSPGKTGSRRLAQNSRAVKRERKKNVEEPEKAEARIKTGWDEKFEISKTPELDEEHEEHRETSEKIGIYSKALFWVLILGIVSIGGLAYYYISNYQKNKELGFDIVAPSKAAVAWPFKISINLENKSQGILREPKILIKLPEGAESLDKSNGINFLEESVADIGPGGLNQKKFNFIFTKEEQMVKKFEVVFSYLPEKLNTRFETSKTVEIFSDQPAISVNLIAPQKVFNREMFEVDVNFQNVSDYTFKKGRLELIFPQNFSFKESSVKPDSGALWKFENMEPGSQKKITIKGILEGPDQSISEIKSAFYAEVEGREFLVTEKSASMGIASSPLSLSVSAGAFQDYIASANEKIQYSIKYRNNTSVPLSDIALTAKLKGEMFDFKTLETSGTFDSANKIVVWDVNNSPQFKILAPSAEGEVFFTIKTLADFPIKRMFDKNFILEIQAEINSPTVPSNISSDRTVGVAALKTKISGKAEFFQIFESFSAFSPKVDQPIVYNIRWQLKNYSTDIKNVKVSGFLQSGVKWLNITSSNIDILPVYNETTGEVVWDIPKILATKGVVGSPAEAVFRIEATPNIGQFGLKLPLLGEVSVSATDEFTGLNIYLKTIPLTTIDVVSN